jgi:glycosyltransferase involved in cell wall biosynthesis
VRVSVCIPAMRAETLPAAIRSIQRQRYTDWELLVVVQGADPPAAPVARRALEGEPRGRVLAIPTPGLSRARNAAFAQARGEIVAVTDDDCEADPDWLGVLVGRLDEDPGAGLVGGALVAPAGSRRGLSVCPAMVPTEGRWDPRGAPPPPSWDWVGASFAIRRSLVDRVGEFDEHLGAGTEFGSAEELDYKLRIEALGVPMWATDRAVVQHTHGARYGLGAVLRHHRNYARGYGGLAGKLTLLGDPRGEAFVEGTLRDWQRDLRSGRPHRAPQHLRRWLHVRQAYERVLSDYRIDHRGLLMPRTVPAPEAAARA